MRSTLRVLVAAALGVLSAVLVACGGGRGLLGGTEGNDLANKLDDVSNAVAANDCRAARKAAAQLQKEATGLPATVDPRLRRSLSSGASTVAGRASSACRPKAKTTTTTVPTGTTTTEATPTQSTSTSTPSTQSTSTSTPSTQSTSTSTPTTTSSTSTAPPTTSTSGTTTSGGAGPGTP